MRFVRYGDRGRERPGIIDQKGAIRSLPKEFADRQDAGLSDAFFEECATLDAGSLPIIDAAVRIGSPVANVGKIVCVGLNYSDHAEEAGMEIPSEPVLFMKATTAICGPNDPIVLPVGHSKVDWEVELGVVIGRGASYVDENDADAYVAGYCIGHDVSERAFQLERGGQWVKGKSFDTFAPLGPWLVSRDEIPDPHNLSVWLEVNDRRKQDSNTSCMIFGIPAIVSYISHVMTLAPGDVILTGTPAGVALGGAKPEYLKAGDTVRLGIEGLGVQEQRVIERTTAS